MKDISLIQGKIECLKALIADRQEAMSLLDAEREELEAEVEVLGLAIKAERFKLRGMMGELFRDGEKLDYAG